MDIELGINEFLRAGDECLTNLDTAGEKAFYVLREMAAGHEDRVAGREILKTLPTDAIR
jgi:hypothetical protein